MRINCHVRAGENVARHYSIECGAGTQFISWLAQTACLQFGQQHYPHGVYVPTMLIHGRDSEDPVPHPR